MNKIENKRKEIEERLKTFTTLQKYRNLDFPNNTLYICKNNLVILCNYYKNTMIKPQYSICLDTLVTTYIINYLNSVKGYINRKIRAIELSKKCIYKDEIKDIIRNHWHIGHKKLSSIDRVIELRDHYEHNRIDGLVLRKIYNKNSMKLELLYEDVNLIQLFIDCYKQLEVMCEEIETFINLKMSECNLRDCILFKEAFERKFGKKEDYGLEPPATNEEIRQYDNLIIDLLEN